MTPEVATIVVGGCVTVAMAVLNALQSHYNRKWQTTELPKRIEEAAGPRTGKVLNSIAENTELTARAFGRADESLEIANGVNEKFLKIHERIEQQRVEQEKMAAAFRKSLEELNSQISKSPGGR